MNSLNHIGIKRVRLNHELRREIYLLDDYFAGSIPAFFLSIDFIYEKIFIEKTHISYYTERSCIMFETKQKQVTGVIFILDITEKTSQKGKPFLIIKARDNHKQEAILKRWQCSENEFPVSKGELALCTIQINSYKEEKQFVIRSVKPAYDGVHADIVDYMNIAPYKASDMYHYILGFAEKNIKNDSYKSVIKNIYRDYKEKLMMWSAAKSVHHNGVSGLLFHIYSMLQAAESYVKIYSFLNKDLLFTGVILHDIGKLEELHTNEFGESEYSIEGNLTGHLYIGADLVTKYKPKDMAQEEFLLLKHMILSHHGKHEYGAVITPKIPEAIALNYIDDMDAKMYQCEHFMNEIHPGTFSDQIWSLETRLYRQKNQQEGTVTYEKNE